MGAREGCVLSRPPTHPRPRRQRHGTSRATSTRGYEPLQVGGAAGDEEYAYEENDEYNIEYSSLGLHHDEEASVTSDESAEYEDAHPTVEPQEPHVVPDDHPCIVAARGLDGNGGGGGKEALARILLERMQRAILTLDGDERVASLVAIHQLIEEALTRPPKERRTRRRG